MFNTTYLHTHLRYPTILVYSLSSLPLPLFLFLLSLSPSSFSYTPTKLSTPNPRHLCNLGSGHQKAIISLGQTIKIHTSTTHHLLVVFREFVERVASSYAVDEILHGGGLDRLVVEADVACDNVNESVGVDVVFSVVVRACWGFAG